MKLQSTAGCQVFSWIGFSLCQGCEVEELPTSGFVDARNDSSFSDARHLLSTITMSFVVRRSLSTLVPPKVASPEGLGAAKDAVRMARIARFYEQLPKGPAPAPQASGLLGRYQARYFGKNPSAAPIWHVIFGIMTLGYSMEYYFHLRHHKNNAH